MLRAAKFAALLDFKIASKTSSAIRRYRNEIRKANTSRLFEELVKIFQTGKSAQIFSVLHELELLKAIFPEACSASHMNESPFAETFMAKRLQTADKSLSEHEELTVTIFIALILADLVKEIFINPDLPNKADYIRKKVFPVTKRMMLPNREQNRLFQIYLSYSRLLRNPHEKHSWPETFRKKTFFYETFMFFKMHAIAENNEENIQKAMFWEIGPRVSPPERQRTIRISPVHRRRIIRDRDDRDRGRGRDDRSRGRSRSYDRNRDHDSDRDYQNNRDHDIDHDHSSNRGDRDRDSDRSHSRPSPRTRSGPRRPRRRPSS